MKNLIKQIGRGIAPLVLTGALVALGACAGKEPVRIDNLVGRNANPANAKPVSEMSVPEQALIYFGVPVSKSLLGEDLVGMTKKSQRDTMKSDYVIVSCTRYGSGMEGEINRQNAASEILVDIHRNDATIHRMISDKSRKIGEYFCNRYNVNGEDIR